jgi:uncharacterized membrane protein YdcZ (DUF606 family)
MEILMNYFYTSMVFFVGFMLPAQVGINARLGMGVLIGSAVVLGSIIESLKLDHLLWSEYCCGSINCFDSNLIDLFGWLDFPKKNVCRSTDWYPVAR